MTKPKLFTRLGQLPIKKIIKSTLVNMARGAGAAAGMLVFTATTAGLVKLIALIICLI